MATDELRDTTPKVRASDDIESKQDKALTSALGGAAVGAVAGFVVPGIGSIIGSALGAALGLLSIAVLKR